MQMHFSAASACGRKNDKEFPGLEAQEQIYAAQARTMPHQVPDCERRE